jgi:transcriptional antiterminator RfaH
MQTFENGWYVMYTKPRHEKKVSKQLERLKIDSYLPTIKTLRKWADRKKYIVMPLFPSYVFVNLENCQSYYDSLEVDGKLNYVRAGKEMARISDSTINEIKLMVGSDESNIEVCSEHLEAGRKLFIVNGPFTGFNCEVVRHRGKQKILVRIDLLHRNLLLDIPVDYLLSVS